MLPTMSYICEYGVRLYIGWRWRGGGVVNHDKSKGTGLIHGRDSGK